MFEVPMLIVCDIPHACILGSDFFEQHDHLLLKVKKYPFVTIKRPPTVCRIMLAEKVEIKPGTVFNYKIGSWISVEQWDTRNFGRAWEPYSGKIGSYILHCTITDCPTRGESTCSSDQFLRYIVIQDIVSKLGKPC